MANNKNKTQPGRRHTTRPRMDTRDQTEEMRATPLIGARGEQEPKSDGRTASAQPKRAAKSKTLRDFARADTAKAGNGREARRTGRIASRKETASGNRTEEIARRVRARQAERTQEDDSRLETGVENRKRTLLTRTGLESAEKRTAARKPAQERATGKTARGKAAAGRGTETLRRSALSPRKATHEKTPVQSSHEKTTSIQKTASRHKAANPEIFAQTEATGRGASRRKIVPPLSQEQSKPVISQILTLVGKKPANLRSRAGEHVPRETLRVIPLGGMCEIGKNMTAYEYGNDIIIVDCGQVFPDETMPGVDTVIPDFTYVLQNRDRVRGIFITHGHEDHIGGLPFLLQELNAPLYAGRMTVELLKYKLDDRVPGLAKRCSLTVVPDGGVIQAGCFSVEFIHVNHSIADAFMFAIRTPIGVVMHSGDFKIDYTPVDGEIMDLQRIAQLGRQGVLLFLCESTNIEVPGFTKSERHVGETLAQMFEGAEGRIFVATFSSNISRLQQIFTAAERHGRKVALVGRSMLNVFNAANNLGYIRMKKDTLIDISEADSFPPEEIVILSTGSQGEPMSALTRIAFSSHKQVELHPGDTVIISASPIPGNEKPIYKVINELYRRGCRVYYSALADVHVSGHASREELKLVHELVRPRYFIPAHGETRMLYQHAEMAHSLGTPYENIFILANGDIFEIGKGGAKVTGFTNGDAVLLDGSASGEVDNAVLQERRMLGDDGVLSAAMAIRKNGELAGDPAVCAMGFLYESEHEKIESAARQFLMQAAERAASGDGVREAVESGQMAAQLRSFLYSRTKRRPVAMVSLIEI